MALNSILDCLEDCPPCPTEEELEGYNSFKTYAEYTQSILSIFGILGNAFAIYILMRKNMRNNFNNLIIALSVFETMNLLVTVVHNTMYGTDAHTLMFPYFLAPSSTFAERNRVHTRSS